MDCLGAAGLGSRDQFVDQQVTVGRFAAAQIDPYICFAGMSGVAIRGAVHRHGGQTKRFGGAHDAAGNFPTVGDQNTR